ncbi:MAG: hypothetical protein IJX20_00580, partial [Alphaproteobacteria bacterium]|nr:hypothetical protein [Alphaproteobacteria bacterium]
GTDISGLTNYDTSMDAKTDFNGKSNTAAIIAGDSGTKAAKYCNDYTTAETSAGDWYLPSTGELYSYVYGNYDAINTTMEKLGWSFGNISFWSSSEKSDNYAYVVTSGYDSMGANFKYNNNSVVCFLDISSL